MMNHFFKYTLAILAFASLVCCKKEPQPVSVQSVTLNVQNLVLEEGETSSLKANILPTDAANKTVSWASNNTNIASVNNGTVTAVAPGSAIITVTTKDGGKKATCNVTVNPIPPAKVTLNKTSIRVQKGYSETLVATISPPASNGQHAM